MTLSISRPRRLATSLIAFATLAGVAAAATHVRDDASFFGAPAAQQAEQQLSAIQQRGGPNVVIETFDQPPGGTRDQIVNAPDPTSRTRAFEQLMDDRAKANNADVYVLVNRTPAQIRVIERRAMQSRGLPAAERDRVASAMRNAFVQKQFDVGLANGVSVLTAALGGATAAPTNAAQTPMPTQTPLPPVQARRDDPTPTLPPATPTGGAAVSRGFGGLGCCTIAGIGLLVVLVVAVVRRMGNRGPGPANYGGAPPAGGYPPGGYPQQGGYPPQAGGGFGRGVAGGVLGGVLGSVLGNQISHGHDTSGQSHGGGVSGGGGDQTRGTSQDTDYTSSSGGDFGTSNDTGGSSDYTSSSGGDFSSGGDSGGGGGDSGGSSGGDF